MANCHKKTILYKVHDIVITSIKIVNEKSNFFITYYFLGFAEGFEADFADFDFESDFEEDFESDFLGGNSCFLISSSMAFAFSGTLLFKSLRPIK